MYDPLQATGAAAPTPAPSDALQQSTASPPATPSKSLTGSRIVSSRPPPLQYQRTPPQQHAPQQQQHQPSYHQQGLRPQPQQHQQHPQFFEHPQNQFQPHHPIFNPVVRSQSPLAPRPPLPGQAPRPVSPLHLQQQQQQHYFQGMPQQAHPAPTPAVPFDATSTYSPVTPNAWASDNDDSPTAPSAYRGHDQHSTIQDRRASNSGGSAPAPLPLPIPSPVRAGFGSPGRVASPGVPRSPVADPHPGARSARTRVDGDDGGPGSRSSSRATSPQQPKERPVPFVRIKVIGTDRAKKEMGIKMEAATNISTYHRRHSPAFSRTYHEFSQLHGALSANHPETILPALPLPQTSATTEEDEDRFLRSVFQKFMDRITRDKALVLDDELRSFIEADFGYTPLTRAKKLKSSAGFLSRSTVKPTLLHSENGGEPDFLMTSKVHSAALETALQETTKALDKHIKSTIATATSYAEFSTALTTFATTETFTPLSAGMRTLADTMRTIAELEVGQSNSSALLLGDSLAYSAIEARSAKEALLQRQYNLEELNNSIKATINKRRNIEKLKSSLSGGGNTAAKSERVNEALEELDEAIKQENQLQSKVLAIGNNLRPSLQNHLKTLNHEMLVTMLNHAKTSLAYENRKLQFLESTCEKIGKIPEKNTAEATIHYHQPASSSGSVPATGSLVGGTVPVRESESAASASVSAGQPQNSRFLATQAQIQAQMRQQQQSRSGLESTSAVNSKTAPSAAQPHNPFRNDATQVPPRSSSISPTASAGPSPTRTGKTTSMAQSMYVPASQPGIGSPTRHPSFPASQQHPQPNGKAGASPDPLAAGSAALSTATPQASDNKPFAPSSSSTQAPGPNSMAQSVFLPGRSANLPPAAGRPQVNPLDERKRADARKAASLLAGAF